MPCFCQDIKISHPMTNSKWVVMLSPITFHLMSNSKWVMPCFSAWTSYHLMTNSLSVTAFAFERQSYHFLLHDEQFVSDTAPQFCKAILFHDQQKVSDAAHVSSRQSHHIWSHGPPAGQWHCPCFPLAYSLIPCLTASECDCQAAVLSGCPISLYPMMSRKWVILPFSLLGSLIKGGLPTASLWVTLYFFLWGGFITSLSMTKQQVSYTTHFSACSLITFWTNRKWVTPPSSARESDEVWSYNHQGVSGHAPSFSQEAHHISLHGQQYVSGMPISLLRVSSPLISWWMSRKWVTLPFPTRQSQLTTPHNK